MHTIYNIQTIHLLNTPMQIADLVLFRMRHAAYIEKTYQKPNALREALVNMVESGLLTRDVLEAANSRFTVRSKVDPNYLCLQNVIGVLTEMSQKFGRAFSINKEIILMPIMRQVFAEAVSACNPDYILQSYGLPTILRGCRAM